MVEQARHAHPLFLSSRQNIFPISFGVPSFIKHKWSSYRAHNAPSKPVRGKLLKVTNFTSLFVIITIWADSTCFNCSGKRNNLMLTVSSLTKCIKRYTDSYLKHILQRSRWFWILRSGKRESHNKTGDLGECLILSGRNYVCFSYTFGLMSGRK